MLKAVVDSMNEVEEKYHDLYEERGGKFHLKRIDGMRTEADVSRVQSALEKERNDHKETKNKFSFLNGVDLEEARERLDRYDELAAKAESSGDIEERATRLAEARIKTTLAPVQRQLDEITRERDQLNESVQVFHKKEKRRTIHDAVRDAAVKSKVRQEALEDALMLAENVFDVDEEDNVRTRDNVGVTPGIDPVVWLSDMQPKRPHWWPESIGGGAGGGNGRNNNGSNPWSADNWNMTEQGKIFKENPDRAQQLARAAGTSIGGSRPSVKK